MPYFLGFGLGGLLPLLPPDGLVVVLGAFLGLTLLFITIKFKNYKSLGSSQSVCSPSDQIAVG
jgi:hypothetical protein